MTGGRDNPVGLKIILEVDLWIYMTKLVTLLELARHCTFQWSDWNCNCRLFCCVHRNHHLTLGRYNFQDTKPKDTECVDVPLNEYNQETAGHK